MTNYKIETLCKGCGHFYPTMDAYDQNKFEDHRMICEKIIK